MKEDTDHKIDESYLREQQRRIQLTGRTTADRIACYEILETAERGEVITYNRLSKACGRDIRKFRSGLDSARDRLLEIGIVFQTVRGVGLRRMEPAEHVRDAQATVIGVRRKAQKGLKRAAAAQVDEMTSAQRIEHAAMSTALGSAAKTTRYATLQRNRQDAIDSANSVAIPSNLQRNTKKDTDQ